MSADHCEHCHHKKKHHCGQCGKHDCECSEKGHNHQETHIQKICCVPGPQGSRGPRGRPALRLPSAFRELVAVFPIPVGSSVILSATVNSPVARDLLIFAAASPHSPNEGAPQQLILRIRVDGVEQPNGAGVTLNNDIENREQRESISLVRLHSFTAGPRTIDLIVISIDSGSQLDPDIGGATLLVEQQAV